VTSIAILEELKRALRYPKISRRHGWSQAQVLEFVEDVKSLAILVPGDLRLKVVAEDALDDRYLECGMEGEASYLVGGDRHLLTLEQYEGVEDGMFSYVSQDKRVPVEHPARFAR
jgi:putative PIN family toxin of toxin-antitoxin system